MGNQTAKIIESIMTPAGGFTKKGIESIGLSWPLKKGWKEELIKSNALASNNDEDGYELIKFYMKSSEAKKLKILSANKMKPISEVISELVSEAKNG